MERDRAHLRGPGHDRDLCRADLVGMTAGRELDPRRLDVVRTMPGCTPFGQRSSVVGRRSSARMIPASTDR
jgi:hypothetical protein